MDDDNVIITEISDNDIVIDKTINALIFPEEHIIETKSDDVIECKKVKIEKKQKIVKDKSKYQNIEDEENIITEKTKTVVRTLKEKKSNIGEDTIPEETTYEFNIEKYPAIAPTILKTSKTINEAIAQQEVVELSTDINNVYDKAQISISTRSAAESIVTQGEEKEETRSESTKKKQFNAIPVLEMNESFSIDHPDTQSPLEDIIKTFNIDSCVATKDIVPKESITISEIHPDQSLGEETVYRQQSKEAKVIIISHAQKIITEFTPSTKEGEIKHEQMPQKKKATQDYVEHESINVLEVNEAHAESQLKEDIKPTPVKSSIEYPLNEQLIVSELHSEIKPEKYYSEIIVPTEVADKLIVASNNAIMTLEVETSEKEGKYNQLKSPIGYNADISIIPEKSIQVMESSIHEKETILPKDKIPETSFPIYDIITRSSIIVNSANQQESEESFTTHSPESHTAIVSLNNANKVCTSSIIEMNEAESYLNIPITPEVKHIQSSVSGLEVPDVTEVIANEMESEFTSQLALELLPATSFTESESYIVTETTTSDFSADLKTNLKYKMDEAVQNFEEVEATQISEVNVHETNVPLGEISKPISVRPETNFAPIQCINVEQTIVAEHEQSLVLNARPEMQKSISVPAHSLQAIVIEEIITENRVNELEELLKNKPTSKIANVNIVDDQSIVVKEVSTFESETDLMVDNKPKNVQAKPVFFGYDVAETTEVISSDAIQQLNIDKHVNDKAKLEHVPYEAFMSEVTCVNELEDILLNKENKQPKTVNIIIDEVIGINVTEQPIYEKETVSIEQNPSKSKNAITEYVPIEIADSSEIVTGDYTLDFIQPETPKLHAYHNPSTFESLILYETDISEKEQVMSNKKTPLECSANSTIVVEEAIEVTEIISDNKPENMSVLITPKEEKAETNIILLKSLERQDVLTCENVEQVKAKNTISAVAHLSQTPLHSLETSLIVSADSETLLSEFVMPDSKKATSNYEDLDMPINVTEILTQDKELDFIANEISSYKLDKQEIVLEEGHSISETIVCSSTSDFDELVPQSVNALMSKTPQIAIELQETSSLEKEGKLLDDNKIQESHADLTYEEIKSIQITEQIQLDTKDELVIQSKPVERVSNLIITGQDVAETIETKAESPIDEFKVEFPKQELARAIQDKELHSFEVSEVITQETESSLSDSQQFNSKIVNISIEDNARSYMVTEIFPKETETQFSEQPKPIHHHAQQEILSYEGLQVNETNTSIREEKLNNFEYSTKTGKQIIEPLESIEISEINVQELEDDLIHPVEPQMKHATHSYNENVGLIIKSTIINEKENELIVDKLKTKTANKVSNLTDYKAPENFEKTTLESVEPMKSVKEDMHQASSEHILLQGISTIVVNIQDNEIQFNQKPKTSENIASLEYEMEQTVDITEVFLGESESDLAPTSLPQKHIAISDLSETQQVVSSFEVLSHNTTDDFNVQTLPSVINLMPVSTETHSFEVTETICHETETPFKSANKLTMNCNFSIQPDQNIEVTEIITNELEGSFEVEEKNKGLKANIVFDENQTITIEEIEASDDVSLLTESMVKPINAKKQFEPLLGLSVVEVRPEESEITHEQQQKPLSKHVTQILPENQCLNVTSNVLGEKESILNSPKYDITQVAQISSTYSPRTVVQLEENIVQMSTADFKTTEPNEIFLESSQIPHESIGQIEIRPLEKETELNIAISGKKEVANIFMDTINIIDTTEIVTGDKESIYLPTVSPNSKHALIDITDSQPVSNVFEVKLEDCSSHLKLPSIVACSAKPSQEVVHGIQITDIATQDKEDIFEEEFKPTSSLANIKVENEKEIKTITEIIAQEMEGQIKNLDMPSPKNAQIEITSGQEIAEKTEILSNTALGSLTNLVPKSLNAVAVQDTHESIQSSITITEDKENPLFSNLIYEKSTAKINLEVSKSVNVTEVVVEDKEGTYIAQDMPKTQIAGENISSKEAAETTFILADVHLTEFDKYKPKEESATVIHETHINLAQTETTVHESEKYLQPTEIVKMNAELIMVPNKGITITEVITDDNDEKLPAKIEQKSQNAITSITTSHEVPQISEIVSSLTTSNVIAPVVITDNAIVSQSELYDTAISTEINTLEKEKIFTQKPKFDEFKAEVKFKEDKSINVAEAISSEMEQPLDIKKPVHKQASITQSMFDVVTVSENSSIEKEQTFSSIDMPESQMVNVTFENNLNVQVSEVNVVDKENDFITPIQKTQTATVPEISTRPVANITEVVTSMNVKDMPNKSQPTIAIASKTQLTCNSLMQTELNISESEGVYETPKNIKENATIQTSTLENIISTEQVVSEKEGILKELENVGLKQANVSLEEIKSSVIVSNVTSEDKVTEFSLKPKRKTSVAKVTTEEMEAITRIEQQPSEKEGNLNIENPKDETAHISFESTQASIIITNVIPDNKEEDLKTQNKIYSKATLTTENFESLISNEQIVSEKEEYFSLETKPGATNATVSIEEPKKGAIISEVTSNEKECDLNETPMRRPSLANVSTEELNPLTTSEAQLLFNTDELKLPIEVEEKAANLKLDELKHIKVEEIVTNETEFIFNEKRPIQYKITPTFLELLPLESNKIEPETQPTDIYVQKPKEHIAKKGSPDKNISVKVSEDIILETAADIQQIPQSKYRASITDTTPSTGKKYYFVEELEKITILYIKQIDLTINNVCRNRLNLF